MIRLRLEHNGKELHAVLFRAGGKAVSGVVRVAGLDALGVFIAPVARIERVRGIDERVRAFQFALGGNVRIRHGVVDGARDRHKELVLGRFPHDARKIPRGRIVVRVGQAVGVREVRPGAAELGGAGVHARDKIGDRAADILRDHVARVVGRGDHRAVEQAFERHRLLLHDVHAAAADDHVKIKPRLRRDRVGERDFAGFDVLHGEQDGHHLRERGGVEPLVGIFRIEDGLLIAVLGEEHGGVRRVDPRIVYRHCCGRDEPQRERGDKSAYCKADVFHS